MKISSLILQSPVGCLWIQATEEEIQSVSFLENDKKDLFSKLILEESIQEDDECLSQSHPLLYEAKKQFKEYFQGTRCYFKLPYRNYGTSIEQKVYRLLSIIPYGYVTSYASLAEMVEITNGARFIGNCMKKNPLLIIVPCHRVISNSGKITGFSAGIERKKYLLQWEKTNWEMSHESSSSGRWLWHTFKRRNRIQTQTAY